MLRLRGPRVRTTPPGLPAGGRRPVAAHAPRNLGAAPRGQRRVAQSRAAAPAGDLPAHAQPLRPGGRLASSSTPGRRRRRRPSRSSRRTTRRVGTGAGAAAGGHDARARALAVALLDLYKRFLSPLLPRACRFEPTCSVYAREAIVAARLPARRGPGRPAPAALPPVPPGRPRSGALDGKKASRRRGALARRPAPLGVARAQAAEAARRSRGARRPRQRSNRRRAAPPAAPAIAAARRAGRAAAGPGERRGRDAHDPVERRLPGDVLQRGAVLTSFVLTGHLDEQKRPLELVRTLPPEFPRPLGLDFGADAADDEEDRRAPSSSSNASRTSSCASATRTPSIAVVKEIRLGTGYLFDVQVSVTGPAYSVLVGPGPAQPDRAERASRYVMPATAVVATADGLKLVRAEKATDKDVWTVPARSFAGIEDNYFLEVLVPRSASTARVLTFALPRRRGQALARDRDGRLRPGRLRGVGLLRPQGRHDPRELRPGPRAHGGFRLVRNPRAAAPVAPEEDLRVRGQLGPGDPRRDVPHPHPALPADGQELRLDEEDAEARAEDERDPGQVQEGEDRRRSSARR